MRIFTRIVALSRGIRLGRQFREIQKLRAELPATSQQQLAVLVVREFERASRSEFPHLYGTPSEERYTPWGVGTDIGYSRMHSDNLQVRMRGIALWLAVAYHETANSPYSELQQLHRQIMRTLRLLREHCEAEADDARQVFRHAAA